MTKLSEITGERAFDVLAEIVPAVAEIASDPRMRELFDGMSADEGSDKYLLRIAKEAAPYLLKAHKAELLTVMAAVEGEERDSFAAKVTPVTLPEMLLNLLTDEGMATLFTCAEAGVTSATSASAVTKGEI